MSPDEPSFRSSYPLGFWARTAGLSALACAVGLWVLRWIFSRELGGDFAPAFYTLKNLLAFMLPALVFCVLVVLLIASVAVFAVAIFASHKVAGPLFRLQRVAGYLGRRILIGRIHLRVGDQGRPVSDQINLWVARRKERLGRLRDALDACDVGLRSCERALGQNERGENEPSLSNLLQKLSESLTNRS